MSKKYIFNQTYKYEGDARTHTKTFAVTANSRREAHQIANNHVIPGRKQYESITTITYRINYLSLTVISMAIILIWQIIKNLV